MNERKQILDEIRSCFADFGIDRVAGLVKKALDLQVRPLAILDAMREGLDEVGKGYESGRYFLSDLITSGIMAEDLTSMLSPYLASANGQLRGKVVIGTVKGDIHDIGKNLVASMLRAHGFQVNDIGVDVPDEKFLRSIEEDKADMLAMSCLLTVFMENLGANLELVKKRGLRIKTMIGGRPVTQSFADQVGADGYAEDAFGAVHLASKLVGKDR
jgi:5-methyltetrahydrofolate--homocysteine methyltransferase